MICRICSNNFLVSLFMSVTFYSVSASYDGTIINYSLSPLSAIFLCISSAILSIWNLNFACSFSALSALSYAFWTLVPIRPILDSKSADISLFSSSISSATASAIVPMAWRKTAHWLSMLSTFCVKIELDSVCSGAD